MERASKRQYNNSPPELRNCRTSPSETQINKKSKQCGESNFSVEPVISYTLNMDESLNDLINNPNPEIADVMKGICMVMMTVNAIHKDVTELKQKFDKYDNELCDMKNSINQQNIKINTLEEQVNIINQQQIDKDVVFTGFPNKLSKIDENTIILQLCQLYKIDCSKIQDHYTFPSKNKTYNFIVKFVNKPIQINLIGQIIEYGAPTLNQLLGLDPDPNNADRVIPCSNRLTKENAEFNKYLRNLKKRGIIQSIRYRNCHFQYKKDQQSEFCSIYTINQIISLKTMYDSNETS